MANALEILKRATILVEYLSDSWNVLSTISTEGFGQFRDTLGTASGQLSFMYRHVEFILGNKDQRLADAHRNVPHVWPAIERALNSPSLYDEAIALLSRRGLDVNARALERDWAEHYRPNESVEAAWRQVYASPSTDNDLYQLGEQLTTFDQQFSTYRWRHFVTVERIIGYKPGTGGSTGVSWLESVTRHRFFPSCGPSVPSFATDVARPCCRLCRASGHRAILSMVSETTVNEAAVANGATDRSKISFEELVRQRRSIRGYKKDPVPREVLEEVVAIAKRAPSSMNTQPGTFM